MKHILFAALGCFAAGHSLAATVAQSQAAITGINLTVSDLTPDDGQTASVRVEPNLGTRGITSLEVGAFLHGQQVASDQNGIEGGVFDQFSSALAGAGTLAIRSGDAQSAAVSFDLDEARAVLAGATLGATEFDNSLRFASISPLVNTRLVISARSQVTLSGVTSFASAFDPNALLATPELQRVLAAGQVVSLVGLGEANFSVSDPDAFGTEGAQATNFYGIVSLSFSAISGVVNDGAFPAGGLATLTIVNDTDQEIVRDVYLSTSAQMSIGVEPIPEPGTWALMGLGLAAVSMVTRQQRRRRACDTV